MNSNSNYAVCRKIVNISECDWARGLRLNEKHFHGFLVRNGKIEWIKNLSLYIRKSDGKKIYNTSRHLKMNQHRISSFHVMTFYFILFPGRRKWSWGIGLLSIFFQRKNYMYMSTCACTCMQQSLTCSKRKSRDLNRDFLKFIQYVIQDFNHTNVMT